ncbi:hypothetical protein I317_04188 [Kwoniella heveanensis CBS 569]|nr:hypothetical protein I317_04188 [Kwoniella heveanensis CBS 569]
MTHRYDSTKVWLDVPVSTVRTAEEGQTVPSDEAPTADMSARIVNTSPNLPNPEDWGSAPALDSLDFGTNATYGHHATSTGLSDLSSVPHNFYGQSPSHPYYVQPGGHYGRGGYYESQADALDDGTNYEDLRRSSEQYSYGRTQVPSLADTAPERQYLSRTHVDPAPRSSLPWGFSSNMATAVPNETHPCIEPVSGPHADYNSNSWEAHMNHPSMYEASNDGTFEETSPPLHSPLPRLRSQSEQQSIGSSQQPNEISLSVQGKAKQPWYKPDAMASEVQQTILEAHSQGPTSDRARLELTRKAFKGRMDKFVNKTRDLFRGEDDTRHELRGMTTSELHFTVADKWILANKDTEIRSIVDENCVEIAEDNGVTILRAKTGVDYVPQSYAIHDGPGALSQVITRPILVCESNSENYWVKLTAARDLASVQQGYLPKRSTTPEGQDPEGQEGDHS